MAKVGGLLYLLGAGMGFLGLLFVKHPGIGLQWGVMPRTGGGRLIGIGVALAMAGWVMGHVAADRAKRRGSGE